MEAGAGAGDSSLLFPTTFLPAQTEPQKGRRQLGCHRMIPFFSSSSFSVSTVWIVDYPFFEGTTFCSSSSRRVAVISVITVLLMTLNTTHTR